MSDPRTLSILVPVYNEERTIAALLDRVAAVRLPGIRKEIIVVDDGSTDHSRAIIEQWRTSSTLAEGDRLAVLDQDNGGKGSAVRHGLARSTGDVVIVQDADLEYNPADYARCIEPILAGRAKVVYGSRRLRPQTAEHSSLAFYLGGVAVTHWFNLLYGCSLTDATTGYKTFSGPLIRALSWDGDGFDWEPEITARLLRLGYEILEVPISYVPRRPSEGKKISWRDGAEAFPVGLRWRLRPLSRDRQRLRALPSEEPLVDAWRWRVRALWTVLVASLVARLAVALPGLGDPAAFFFRPDSTAYVEPARSLAARGAYNVGPDSSTPATLRPPGYPAFLAGLFLVGGGGLRFPVVAFCVLGALTCWPVFLGARQLSRDGPAVLAAALFGFNLTSVATAPLYVSDTLFTFLVAWQFFLLTRFAVRGRLLDAGWAMLVAGAAALVRPIGLPWIVPAAILIVLVPRLPLRRRALALATGILVFAACVVPWMWRNERVGAGVRLDTNVGNTLLYHNAATLLSVVSGEAASSIRQRLGEEIRAEFAAYPARYPDEDSRVRHQLRRAREEIARHPLTYLRLHLNPWILLPDVATFFEDLGLTRTGQGTLDVLYQRGLVEAARHYFKGRLPALVLLTPAFLVVAMTYAGCVAQVARWLVDRSWWLLLLFLACVVYYLVLPGPIVMPRYQMPALPMMCAMAAMAMSRGGGPVAGPPSAPLLTRAGPRTMLPVRGERQRPWWDRGQGRR